MFLIVSVQKMFSSRVWVDRTSCITGVFSFLFFFIYCFLLLDGYTSVGESASPLVTTFFCLALGASTMIRYRSQSLLPVYRCIFQWNETWHSCVVSFANTFFPVIVTDFSHPSLVHQPQNYYTTTTASTTTSNQRTALPTKKNVGRL